MFPIIILCGGLGSRLSNLTKKIPKSLVDIDGIPFIYYQLKLLEKNGFDQVILSTGYKGEIIKNYIYQNDFNLSIKFSDDGDILRGTGGAIKKAISEIQGDHFFVMYGDSYLDFNFEIAEENYTDLEKGLLLIYKNNQNFDVGNVIFEDNEIKLYDKKNPTNKMDYIDYGSCILHKKFFEGKPDIFDLSDLYHELSILGKLNGLVVENRFFEIGSYNGLKEFENKIKKEKV